MRQTIRLAHRTIEYTLATSGRAKRLRLAVYQGGQFKVTAPKFLSLRAIEQFIIHKSHWVLKQIDNLAQLPPPVKIQSSRVDFIKYRVVAKKIARDKMRHFNTFYGFRWKKISIKNQKTRWGSCSKQGNINFNYKIALLPEHLVNYIIVHELCHLAQLNHSKQFWQLVAITIPDHSLVRKELTRYSYARN